jgi:hypothetical protein
MIESTKSGIIKIIEGLQAQIDYWKDQIKDEEQPEPPQPYITHPIKVDEDDVYIWLVDAKGFCFAHTRKDHIIDWLTLYRSIAAALNATQNVPVEELENAEFYRYEFIGDMDKEYFKLCRKEQP